MARPSAAAPSRPGSAAPAVMAAMAAAVALLALVPAAPALADPTDVVVAPLTAGDGEAVEVSGSGCTGAVDVTLSVPDAAGTGTVVAEQASAVADADGSWSTTLTMRGSAALVVATCDGVTSGPVVVGDGGSGTDVASGYADDDGSVTVLLEALDIGSTARVVTPEGVVVGETEIVAGARTSVEVPGPDNVVLVVLGLEAGVPVSELVQTPSRATLVAEPRVTTSGTTVTVFGTQCVGVGPGTVDVEMRGESEDWYDPPQFWRMTSLVADADGSWRTTFSMPAEAVLVHAGCTLDGEDRHFVGHAVVGASDAQSGELVAIRDGDDVVVTTALGGEAFTLDGRALVTEESPGALRVHDAPGRFLVVAYVLFGPENAEAVVLDSPDQWFVDVPPAAPPAAPPADPATPPAAAPVRGGAELAATGPAAVDQALLALLLVAVGAGCVVGARGRRRAGAAGA